MRDTLKSKEYFEEYLKNEKKLIKSKELKMKASSDSLMKKRILLNLIYSRENVLVASFSAGANTKDLNKLLLQLVDDVAERGQITYNLALRILSFAVILDNKDCVIKISEAIKSSFNDSVLKGFISFETEGKADWGDGKLEFYDSFSKLYDVVSAPTKPKRINALSDYLEFWSDLNADIYESSKSDNKNYTGFWCFEAAAIAKIFKMDNSVFSEYAFYPVL